MVFIQHNIPLQRVGPYVAFIERLRSTVSTLTDKCLSAGLFVTVRVGTAYREMKMTKV